MAWHIHIISKPNKCNTLEGHNMQLQQHEANDSKSVARMKNEVTILGTLFKNCLQVYKFRVQYITIIQH